MTIYLGLSAVAVFVAAFLLLLSGEIPFLAAAHLVFALGVLPLIFGAIAAFVPVLTRGRRAHPAVALAPLLLQAAGLSAFLYFDGLAGKGALHGAAGLDLLLALIVAVWLVLRARTTLGQPHPGWIWYLTALLMLSLALAAVLAMDALPDAYRELRLLHLHLNTLGFVGLAALGTLQVLLPTALGVPDSGAATRLRFTLWPAAGGVLAVGLGAAFSPPLALFGTLLLLFVGVRVGADWLRLYGLRGLLGDGAAIALSGALLGFLLLMAFGLAHGFKLLDGRDAATAFVAIFLLPLVSGALTQLLPVWRWPGPRHPPKDRMRSALAIGGGVRSLLFLLGGTIVALGNAEGLWLAAAGLLLFVVRLGKAFASAGAGDSGIR